MLSERGDCSVSIF